MRYERYVLPLTAVAALSAAGVAGYLAWQRRRDARSEEAGELGAFIYSYPLETAEEVSMFTAEDLLVDEEMFPGFSQDD